MRCLWLARSLPFPLTAGDRIYSAKLATALARAGAEVTLAGFAANVPLDATSSISWHVVPGRPRGRWAGLASRMPLVAARHATSNYRATLDDLARQSWDAVIIDQYGMGWVAERRAVFARSRPIFVFVAHDHEESITRMQWQDRSAATHDRVFLFQNYLKTRWLERRIARRCDLVTTITETDAVLFRGGAPATAVLPLLPGYDGPRVAERSVPLDRAIVLFGSYRWSAKQANLRSFLDQADPICAAAGIEIRVVGDMPEELRSELQGRYRATAFIGFVADPTPHLAASRLAVVAEPIGGGFKIKLLEYIFNRVPVAALEACVVGLPDDVRSSMLLASDLQTLMPRVVNAIDDRALLDGLQRNAFVAADGAFEWTVRGEALLAAIRAGRARMAQQESSLPLAKTRTFWNRAA